MDTNETAQIATETEKTEAPAAVEAKVVEAVKKVNARRVKTERKPRKVRASVAARPIKAAKPVKTIKPVRAPKPRIAAAPAATPFEKETVMNFDASNWLNSLPAFPGADKFQSVFADTAERSQQLVERSQKAAGDLAELTRANVEAMVETGRIAAAGVQTLGQDAVARTREGLEQTAAQVKSLAEAGSPTEFLQLQGEIARTQFDRMVAEGSRFAESMVKLAGEAIQPLSNRAAVNAEKFSELTA